MSQRYLLHIKSDEQVKALPTTTFKFLANRTLMLQTFLFHNETKTEIVLMDKLYADKQEWDEIQAASSEYISEEFSMSSKDYNTH